LKEVSGMEVSAKGALRAAWRKDFKKVVAKDLDQVAEIIVSAFRRCMTEETGKSPADCLRDAAKEAKLGEKFREVYSKRRAELKALTSFDWSLFLSTLRTALESAVKDKVAEAFRRCMRQTGKTAADCYREAAEEAKLGDAIKKAWNETSIELTV